MEYHLKIAMVLLNFIYNCVVFLFHNDFPPQHKTYIQIDTRILPICIDNKVWKLNNLYIMTINNEKYI